MRVLFIALLVFHFRITKSYQFDNVLSIFRRSNIKAGENAEEKNIKDMRNFPSQTNIQTKGKGIQQTANIFQIAKILGNKDNFRRHDKQLESPSSHDDSYRDSSTSTELAAWRVEFDKNLKKRKLEAFEQLLNATNGKPFKDRVNMAAARPWAKPCGDTTVHDQAWGTCLLSVQCDPEFRIYRGDHMCKYTQFVCCSVQETQYDMSEALDSIDDSSASSNSKEKRLKQLGSKEIRRRKRARARYRRKRKIRVTKDRIKRLIRDIGREIDRILVRTYRNYQKILPMRVEKIKKYIKDLKRQFRMDRKVVLDLHNEDIHDAVDLVQKKIKNLYKVDFDKVMNGSLKEILNYGSMSKGGLRTLNETYPDLVEYVNRDIYHVNRLPEKKTVPYSLVKKLDKLIATLPEGDKLRESLPDDEELVADLPQDKILTESIPQDEELDINLPQDKILTENLPLNEELDINLPHDDELTISFPLLAKQEKEKTAVKQNVSKNSLRTLNRKKVSRKEQKHLGKKSKSSESISKKTRRADAADAFKNERKKGEDSLNYDIESEENLNETL